MTSVVPSRDTLVAALTSAWIDGPRGRLLMRAEYGMEACEDFADALLASGVVVTPDVYLAGLAEDEVAVEAIAADQKEAADSWGEPLPGAERSLRARTALRALAAAGRQKRTGSGTLLACVEGGLTPATKEHVHAADMHEGDDGGLPICAVSEYSGHDGPCQP